jgi:hypothetical protein
MSIADQIQVAIAVCSAAAAIAAAFAARAAWVAVTDSKAAAHDSKRAAQAGLFSTLMAQYGSPEMGEALRALARWLKHGDPPFTTAPRHDKTPSFEENVLGWARHIASRPATVERDS